MSVPAFVLMALAIGLIVFLALGFYGRYLEREPERTAVGRAVAAKYEAATQAHVDEHMARVYEQAYADGIEAMRAQHGAVEPVTEPIAAIDLDGIDWRRPRR